MSKQHQAKLADPSAFDHFDTHTNEGGAGIDFQYGVMGDGTRTLQAIIFDAENISAEAAQAWLKQKNLTVLEFVVAAGDGDGEARKAEQECGPASDIQAINYNHGKKRGAGLFSYRWSLVRGSLVGLLDTATELLQDRPHRTAEK